MNPPGRHARRHRLARQGHRQDGHRREAAARRRAASGSSPRAARSTCASRACPRCWARSWCIRILDKENLDVRMEQLGFRPEATRDVPADAPPAARARAGHRADRQRQDDHAVLRARPAPQPRAQHLTVEDPVEYQLDLINQIQVQESIGLTFARALRSILRQDPDIIMVGEIRDEETARVARAGRAHRAPRPRDAAHQRRARRGQPACSTWASSRTCSPAPSTAWSRSDSSARVCDGCVTKYYPSEQVLEDAGLSDRAGRRLRQGRRVPRVPQQRLPRPGRHLRGHGGHARHPPHGPPRRREPRDPRRAASPGSDDAARGGRRVALAGVSSLEEVLRATRLDEKHTAEPATDDAGETRTAA